MKFSNLFDDLYSPEELINEGKKYGEDKFDRFMENAGWWLFDQFQNTPSDVRTLPGYGDYVNFAKSRSKDELDSWDNLVYTLPDYYGDWINLMPEKDSNKIMSQTIARFNLQDKMSGRENYVPKKRGRKPKSQNVEPESDAMSHFDQAIEKKRRGRPSLPDDQKKRYIPTGVRGGARVGAGRPRKERTDDESSYQDIIDKLKRGRGRPRKVVDEPTPEFTTEPTSEFTTEPTPEEPTMKQRGGARTGAGRPSKESRYEPVMLPSKIKTLEDRINSIEALLREKGILEEQRIMLKNRLRMMKDYQKFL